MPCRQSAICLLSRQEREALAPFTAGQSMLLIVVECGIGVTIGCLAPDTMATFHFEIRLFPLNYSWVNF